MKKICTIVSVAVLLMFTPYAAMAGPVLMHTFASAAPNGFGSPSWAGYLTHALPGIDNFGIPTGTPGDPTYYESGTTFDAGAFVVSSFNSWMGEVNPAAPYDLEYGTRMHFGLRAESAEGFMLQDLNYDMHSSDPSDSLVFTGSFTGSAYSATRVGINYGVDGIRGTSDDVVFNSGEAASNLVNLLLYVGVGNAFWPGAPEDMADTLAYINSNGGAGGPFTLTTTYSFGGQSTGSTTATASVAATTVPEPGNLVLLGVGTVFAIGFGRRRQELSAQ